MEMHILHKAKEIKAGVKYAAFGILFDTSAYSIDKINNKLLIALDKFFNSLKWDDENLTHDIDSLPLDELMQ
jgi:hypothetical protein